MKGSEVSTLLFEGVGAVRGASDEWAKLSRNLCAATEALFVETTTNLRCTPGNNLGRGGSADGRRIRCSFLGGL